MGDIFGDETMAAALIERLLRHCHIVNIRGNSYGCGSTATSPSGAPRPSPGDPPRPRSVNGLAIPGSAGRISRSMKNQ